MTPQALTALQQSIEHWRRLATGQRKPDESVGACYCALCREFNPPAGRYTDRVFYCVGCPVMERTGNQFCYTTPWEKIEKAMDDHNDERDTRDWLDNSPEARALAAEELAFLESLLPQDSQK